MKPDDYSYQCGAIDCCNEMVCLGVKSLAFIRPFSTAEARDTLIPFSRESCRSRGTRFYPEDAPLLTDLFPLSETQGKFLILFYKEGHILEQYIRLKERKAALVAEGAYFGGNRTRIAWEYGKLLSYPDEVITENIQNNEEKEIFSS